MPEPQVPSIAPVQTAPSGSGDDINAVLGTVAQQIQAPLPPQYIQGTDLAQPKLPPAPVFTQRNENNQPMTNQATSIRMARNKNAFAEIANSLGQAGKVLQERKNENLKNDLTQVMKAKQNIANANLVLQQDPNNEMAKKVLAQNKLSLETILNDPKKQKMLAKAFDISFTDPEKNKKPEIKAGQEALKEFKEAGIFNNDNPEEAKMAAMAAQGQQPKAPQAQQQSGTPRADAATAKDLPTIAANPQYAAALKEKQDAQKQLVQYVLPRMIAAETQKQIQALKEGRADARAEYKAVTDFQKSAMEMQSRMDIADATAKAAMARTIARDTAAMARTRMEIKARFKMAADKRLDPVTSMKLKTEALDKVDNSLKQITSERSSLSTQLGNAKTDEERKVLGQALDYNELKLKATNQYRQEVATKVYGTVSEGRDDRLGYGSNKQVVGSNLSDEPDDDEDDPDEDEGGYGK